METTSRDLFIGNDCVVREVNCLHFATTSGVACEHKTIDYTKPNSFDCWHCCDAFDNLPIPVPHDYDVRIDKFRVSGNL